MKPRGYILDISILISHKHLNDKSLAQLRQKGSPKQKAFKAVPEPRSGLEMQI